MGNTQHNLKRERTAYWFNGKCWDMHLKSIKHLKSSFYRLKEECDLLSMRWCCWNYLKPKKRQNFYAKIIAFNKATYTWNNRQLFVPFCRKACGHKRSLYLYLKMCLFSAFFFLFFYFENIYYLTRRSVNYYFYWLLHFIALQRH